MNANPSRALSLLGLVLLADVVLACALLLAGPYGTRAGWWAYGVGLNVLMIAVALALCALAGGLVVAPLCSRRNVSAGASRAAMAAALAFLPLAMVGPHAYKAFTLPFIHDVSTDLEDPPVFQAPRILSAPRENSLDHGGATLATQQRSGYPDLGPILSQLPVGGAFAHAHDVALGLGWEIVEAEPEPARIEAVATTRWFGFRDDVAIRIRAEGDGSRIDLRSVSRVGESDVGANAARIRAFVDAFQRTATADAGP